MVGIHHSKPGLLFVISSRYEESRLTVSKFINSPSHNNIIFTKSATEGINLVSSCLSRDYFKDGDEVKKGDVLCIVEAMKMMNEIKSDYDGKIISIEINDEQPVEFGQTIIVIQ